MPEFFTSGTQKSLDRGFFFDTFSKQMTTLSRLSVQFSGGRLIDKSYMSVVPLKSENFTNISFKMQSINPLDVSPYSKLMTVATFNKYKASWVEFCRHQEITCDKPPQKENFELFFEAKREEGLAGTTLRALYSHLNKMFQCVYSKTLMVN